MTEAGISVIWSDAAKNDLKSIFDWIIEVSQSRQAAINVRNDIIKKSKEIVFAEQYQVEEYLGEPYRRMVVRHFKIIYKIQNPKEIRILKIFDTHQNPLKLKDD